MGGGRGAGSTILLLKLFVVFLWVCPYKVPGFISREVERYNSSKHWVRGTKHIGGAEDFVF